MSAVTRLHKLHIRYIDSDAGIFVAYSSLVFLQLPNIAMEYFETSDIELWIFLNYAFFKHVPTICNIISIYVSNYSLTSFRK